MRKSYDFDKMPVRTNPYVERLKKVKTSHWAELDNSQRLLTIYGILRVRRDRETTTMDICRFAGVTNPAREISELRKNGKKISCTYLGLSESKKRVYSYRLEEE